MAWRILAVVVSLTIGFCDVALADKTQARIHYERATAHYNLGEYQAALDEFQAAYKEFRDPVLLFNIAQCHRQLGSRQKAITVYKSYLRETGDRVQNADEVKKVVARLEDEIAKDAAEKPKLTSSLPVTPPVVTSTDSTTAEPTVVPVATTVSPSPEIRVEPPKKKSRAWIWGVAAGSVVVVGVAIGLGVGLGLQPRTPDASFGTATVR